MTEFFHTLKIIRDVLLSVSRLPVILSVRALAWLRYVSFSYTLYGKNFYVLTFSFFVSKLFYSCFAVKSLPEPEVERENGILCDRQESSDRATWPD